MPITSYSVKEISGTLHDKLNNIQNLDTITLCYLTHILTIHPSQTRIMAASARKRAKEDDRRKKEKVQEEKESAKRLKEETAKKKENEEAKKKDNDDVDREKKREEKVAAANKRKEEEEANETELDKEKDVNTINANGNLETEETGANADENSNKGTTRKKARKERKNSMRDNRAREQDAMLIPTYCRVPHVGNTDYIHTAADNPTINSSIVRFDSYCSHKPHGTSKPHFPSTKGYLPSITSISKIQYILQ